MLAVIDYGAGNLRSVLHALKHIGVEDMQLVRHPQELEGASKIILPGVGAFGASIQQLHKQDLVKPLQDAITGGIPYLGICVGMQLLFEIGEEMGEHEGLGILAGRVVRFPQDDKLKVPHMGWNQLHIQRESCLLKNLDAESYAYFVHSYYCAPSNESDVVATVDYGLPFTAVIQRDNIYGVQFHPEKSQTFGLQILKNFLALAEAA